MLKLNVPEVSRCFCQWYEFCAHVLVYLSVQFVTNLWRICTFCFNQINILLLVWILILMSVLRWFKSYKNWTKLTLPGVGNINWERWRTCTAWYVFDSRAIIMFTRRMTPTSRNIAYSVNASLADVASASAESNFSIFGLPKRDHVRSWTVPHQLNESERMRNWDKKLCDWSRKCVTGKLRVKDFC